MPILEGRFAQDPGVLSSTSILGQGNSTLLALLGQATQIGARINANQLAQEGNFLAERGRLDTLAETQREFDITSAQRKHEFNLTTARNVLEFNSRNNLEKQKMADINKRDIRDTQENNARYDKALGFTIEDRARVEKDRQSQLDFINRLTGGNKTDTTNDFVGPKTGGSAYPEDFVGPRLKGTGFPEDFVGPQAGGEAFAAQNLLPAPVAGVDLLPPPETRFTGNQPIPPFSENQSVSPAPNREDVLNKLLNVDSGDLGKGMVEGTVAPADAIDVANFKAQSANEKLANAKRLEALLDTKGISADQKFTLSGLVKKLNVEGKNESEDAKKLSQSAWKLLTRADTKTSSSSKIDVLGDFSKPVTKEENDRAQEVSNAIAKLPDAALTAQLKEQLAKSLITQERFKNQPATPDAGKQGVDPNEVKNLDGSVGNNQQAPVTEDDRRYDDEKINSLAKVKSLATFDGGKPPASVFLEILKEANNVGNSSTVAAPGSLFGTASGGSPDFSASDNLVKALGAPKAVIDATLNEKDPKTGRTVLESFLDSVANEGNRFAFQKAGLGDIFDPLRYTAKTRNYLDVKGDTTFDAGDEFLKKANLQGTKK